MSEECKHCVGLLETCHVTIHGVTGQYKGHQVCVERDDSNPEDNWYITVQAPDGTYVYDGWWRDSSDKTAQEAIAEALSGAQLK